MNAAERAKRRVPEVRCSAAPSRTVFVPRPGVMARWLKLAPTSPHFHKEAGGAHGGGKGEFSPCTGKLSGCIVRPC